MRNSPIPAENVGQGSPTAAGNKKKLSVRGAKLLGTAASHQAWPVEMGPGLLCHVDKHIDTPMRTINRMPIPPAVMTEGGSEHNVTIQ
jgi:hypothetical protein